MQLVGGYVVELILIMALIGKQEREKMWHKISLSEFHRMTTKAIDNIKRN